MTTFRTFRSPEVRTDSRPRGRRALVAAVATISLIFGASVPASAMPVAGDIILEPLTYWGDGDNVAVAPYFNNGDEPVAEVTGVYEVVGYPAAGEAGTVTVRVDFSTWAVSDYALWHAYHKTSMMVGTQTTSSLYYARNLSPTEHLATFSNLAAVSRSDRDYAWMKFQVGADWNREILVQGTGNWVGPETGKVASPVEEGPDGISVEILDWQESVYDQTITYSVRVTVDAATVGVAAGTIFKVVAGPNAVDAYWTIPPTGGSVVINGQINSITEANARVWVLVNAANKYGSHLYHLTDRSIGLGYVNPPPDVSLTLDQWEVDGPGVWWEATINTHSLAGAPGEVCDSVYAACRATVYAVTDTGQLYPLKSSITVMQRRGYWTTTVTNIGGTALPIRNYVAVFVRITGQPVYGGPVATLESPLVPVVPDPGGDDGTDDDIVRVRAIEVTQSVQDWQNSVGPLVAGKGTIARVFLETGDPSLAVPMSGSLVAVRDNETLPGEAKILNKGGAVLPVVDATTVRGDLGSSLNFVLPREWTESGVVSLEFIPDTPEGVEAFCRDEALPTSDDCRAEVAFEYVPPLSFEYVAFSWSSFEIPNEYGIPDYDPTNYPGQSGLTPPSGTPIPVPGAGWPGIEAVRTTNGDAWEQHLRVTNMLPLAWPSSGLGFRTAYFIWHPGTIYTMLLKEAKGEVPTSTDAKFVALKVMNSYLAKLRTDDGCKEGCETMYVGVASADGTPGLRSGGNGRVISVFTNLNDSASASGVGRNTGSHEMGHVFGLGEASELREDGSKGGTCGEHYIEGTPLHPFWGEGLMAGGNVTRAPVLGPLGNADTEIWGLDVRAAHHPQMDALEIISPYEAPEVMGYCVGSSPQDTWASGFTWEVALSSIQEDFFRPSSLRTSSGMHRSLVLSGLIGGSDTDYVIAVWPPEVSAEPLSVEADGPFAAVVYQSGQEIARQYFDMEQGLANSDGSSPPASLGLFEVTVPIGDASFDRIEFLHEGEIVEVLEASAYVPEIGQVHVETSAAAKGEAFSISWNQQDRDDDVLLVDVSYSADGGTSWRAVQMWGVGNRVEIPAGYLSGSSEAMIQVSVSDGMHRVTAVSDVFTLADSPPVIMDFTGLDDAPLISGAQAMWASVSVVDQEDEEIAGQSIRWVSNIDGEIATGDRLIVEATSLSQGTHLISVIATDSAGQSVVATRLLRVTHEPTFEDPPPIEDDVVVALLPGMLDGMDLHNGARNALGGAIAGIEKELGRDRTDHACKELDRFFMLVDNFEGKANGLTTDQAGLFGSVGSLLSEQIGCEAPASL